MDFRHYEPSEAKDITEMFEAVFGASEGEAEGKQTGGLVGELLKTTSAEDFLCLVAVEDEGLLGSIFFSRLSSASIPKAFILAPLAVSTMHQGKGIGQKLIRYGIDELKGQGVQFVITYGDPAFYGRLGFRPISPEAIRPPHRLSQPEGWLGLSLSDVPIEEVSGDITCVEALNHQAYW